jgi:hypothetical protein
LSLLDLLSAILPTASADTVAQHRLATGRTDDRKGREKPIMRTAIAATGFGGAFLWYWHVSGLSFKHVIKHLNSSLFSAHSLDYL